MKILGTEKTSMIEWQGHISYVIFLGGCNLNCPWCYVPDLVNGEGTEMNKEDILEEIQERMEFIDSVCITGGEATLNPDLPAFLEEIKSINGRILIRIETNGTNPDMLIELADNQLIDSVVMDVKNSKEKYPDACNTKLNLSNIEKSISILKVLSQANFNVEFRTTLVPGIHETGDILEIAHWLYNSAPKGKISYTLQQFRSDLPNQSTLNPAFIKNPNYPREKIEAIKEELKNLNYFKRITIRAK
jgi:pyruvate formate lyase activating enzyme